MIENLFKILNAVNTNKHEHQYYYLIILKLYDVFSLGRITKYIKLHFFPLLL